MRFFEVIAALELHSCSVTVQTQGEEQPEKEGGNAAVINWVIMPHHV